MRLIDADFLKEDLTRFYDGEVTARQLIDAQPTVQLAPSEPCEDDTRADVYYLAEKIGIHQLYALVVQLRGEPEPCEDAISRQTAIGEIKALYEWHDTVTEDRAVDHLKRLPSAQPEIIRCKDCKWKNRYNCTRAVEVFIDDDKYCAWAERRTDG